MTTIDPDDLFADQAIAAAVGALAARNEHHLQGMSPDERAQAAAHWRELAIDVLTAARAAVAGGIDEEASGGDGRGRAVVILEDAGEEDVNIHVSFHPELEDLGNDQVAGTPAQITAVALLESLGEEQAGE